MRKITSLLLIMLLSTSILALAQHISPGQDHPGSVAYEIVCDIYTDAHDGEQCPEATPDPVP